MEAPKFRSIPITIIDFLAIFLPGFVWLLLFFATFQLISAGDISPKTSYRVLLDYKENLGAWTLGLIALICSLLIGNILKPITMEAAEKLVSLVRSEALLRVLFKWYMDIKKFDKINGEIEDENTIIAEENRKIAEKNESRVFKRRRKKSKKKLELRKLKFPFDELHSNTPYYKELKKSLGEKINCEPAHLPGHQLFSIAKRYIRFISPTLWEESERMEAEVRMSGALFLASAYNVLLIVVAYLLEFLNFLAFGDRDCVRFCVDLKDDPSILFWLVLSCIALVLLLVGWTHLRHNEVSYTYMNTLIALKNQTPKEQVAPNEEK